MYLDLDIESKVEIIDRFFYIKYTWNSIHNVKLNLKRSNTLYLLSFLEEEENSNVNNNEIMLLEENIIRQNTASKILKEIASKPAYNNSIKSTFLLNKVEYSTPTFYQNSFKL